MPSPKRNKWLARAKRDGVQYNLGTFDTYIDARIAERVFAAAYPASFSTHHKERDLLSSPLPKDFALPLQGKHERRHLYRWIREEELYVHTKFSDERNGHDESLATRDLSRFWVPQVVQYYDRATLYLDGSKHSLQGGDTAEARFLERKAQQAMCKAMMTAKGMVESSIRVFGPLPMPGVPSGEIGAWIEEL